MHRCLNMQEILSNIFTLIYWDIYNPAELQFRDTHRLSYLARTCKTFYEPAITILWSYQSSILPLVRCLPRDAYVEKKKKYSNVLHISRDLLPSDFDRIRFHAQKIKELDVTDERFTICTLSPQALALLLLRRPQSEPLLPNLRHLALDEHLFEGVAIYPRLVVGRRLESVRINMEDDFLGRSWDNVRTVLSPYVPTLKSFSIDFEELDSLNNTSMSIHLLQLYSIFRDLVHLKTRVLQLSNEALIRISTLPFLQRLDLDLRNINLSSFPKIALDQLTDLTLVTANLDNVKTFLSSVAFKDLRTVSIERDYLRDRDIEWDFRIFSETLSNRHRNCPLASITLLVPDRCHEMGDVEETPLKKADLQPLLVFPLISTLAIDHCSALLLDDAILMEMSSAWPKLRNLHLRDEIIYDEGVRPQFTTVGVINFSRSCPNLENLTLCFDAEKTPKFASYDAMSSTPSHLKQLSVCYSPIMDADLVAQSLILAFPSLQEFNTLHVYGSGDDEPHRREKKWIRVASLLADIIKWRRCN